MPECSPACIPAESRSEISRRNTRHQSFSSTSRNAIARMISVVACDPELPPLDNNQRQENRQHRRLLNFLFEITHRGRREHFAHEQDDSHGARFFRHVEQPDLQIRRIQRLHAAQFLDVFRRFLFRHVQDVIHRHHPHSTPANPPPARSCASYFLKAADRRFLVVRCAQRKIPVFQQLRHGRVRLGHHQFRNRT